MEGPGIDQAEEGREREAILPRQNGAKAQVIYLQVLLGLWGRCVHAGCSSLDLPSPGLHLPRGPLETAIPGISPGADPPTRLPAIQTRDSGATAAVTRSGLASRPHWNQTAWRMAVAGLPHLGGRKCEEEGH